MAEDRQYRQDTIGDGHEEMHGHHQHYHQGDDYSSQDDNVKESWEKKKSNRAIRKQNALILFAILCFFAFSMMAFVVFIYLND